MQRVINGYIYENGEAKEINFILGENLKIQAKGIGTYEVCGRMRDGEYQKLSLVDTQLNTSETAEDSKIYSADVAGLSFITVTNVVGNFDNIYFDVYTGGNAIVRTAGGGGGGGAITVDDELSLTSTNPVQNKVITAALNNKADETEIDDVVDDAISDNTATSQEVEDAIESLDNL